MSSLARHEKYYIPSGNVELLVRASLLFTIPFLTRSRLKLRSSVFIVIFLRASRLSSESCWDPTQRAAVPLIQWIMTNQSTSINIRLFFTITKAMISPTSFGYFTTSAMNFLFQISPCIAHSYRVENLTTTHLSRSGYLSSRPRIAGKCVPCARLQLPL
jgi:hypothetical protein